MTLAEFLAAADAGTDLKVLGKMLKDLPVEDRRTAGMRFQEIKTQQIKPTASPPKRGWSPPGRCLWSLDRGPFGHGIEMYDGALLIRGETNAILVTGSNLRMKELSREKLSCSNAHSPLC